MKLQRNVSAVMAALVLTGMTCSAFATEINATSDKAEELLGLTMGSPVQLNNGVTCTNTTGSQAYRGYLDG